MRVAIVAADSVSLYDASASMRERQWDVHLCPDGERPLPFLKRVRPDVIILDIWLGGPGDGWNLLQVLKLDEATRDLPVLTYAGSGPAVEAADWLAERGIRVLAQQLDAEVLVSAIEQVHTQRVNVDLEQRAAPSTVPGELRIVLLGGFHVSVGGRRVADAQWPLQKARSLLKILALRPNHRLSREVLIDLLWPALDVVSGTNNLHKALFSARHSLEPDLPYKERSSFLRLDDSLVMLAGPAGLSIDVDEFERDARAASGSKDVETCRTALRQYGELLPEDRYEEWTTIAREKIEALRVGLLVHLGALELDPSVSTSVVSDLRSVVQRDPSNEDAQATLMLLLAQSGQRAGALRQFESLEEALWNDLAVQPRPDVRQLRDDIRQGNENLRSPS